MFTVFRSFNMKELLSLLLNDSLEIAKYFRQDQHLPNIKMKSVFGNEKESISIQELAILFECPKIYEYLEENNLLDQRCYQVARFSHSNSI